MRTVNSYDSKRNGQVVLPPGSTVRQRWELAASHCWYDLTVTDARGGGWLRRFAGHHETGRPGYSDPATRS